MLATNRRSSSSVYETPSARFEPSQRVRRPLVCPGFSGLAGTAQIDESVVVEAYAHQGKLKGAQSKKIAQEILKLALLKREVGRENTQTIVALASQEARDSITGWLLQAAVAFDVQLRVVDVPQKLRDAILQAQVRQVMVNLDEVADDVGSDTQSIG